MNTPDSPDYTEAPLGEDLLLKLKSRTGNVLSSVASLLESGTIVDEADRGILVASAAFIENPTENLPDLMNHTTNIGMVIGGYDMQGADIPAEIDAMHAWLLSLQCINRINFVEAELEQGSADSPEIQQAMALALDWATILSKGYKDDALLTAVNELQGRL